MRMGLASFGRRTAILAMSVGALGGILFVQLQQESNSIHRSIAVPGFETAQQRSGSGGRNGVTTDGTGTKNKKARYAVGNYIDKYWMVGSVYGVYSIHTQLFKFNMTDLVDHVVLVSPLVPEKFVLILNQFLGEKSVRIQDNRELLSSLLHDDKIWAGTFNKVSLFNVTEYDKIIVLDNDILIRKNIMHWFDYPTPAATHSRGTIEWNSGAMVISPDADVFDKMVETMHLVKVWAGRSEETKTVDGFNSAFHDQGFLSAFFTSNVTSQRMHTMPYYSSMLSSDISHNGYFFTHRDHLIETIHFSANKPWREKEWPRRGTLDLCRMLTEWNESLAGIEQYGDLDRLGNFLVNCV
jgi:hypothetical protein